MIRVVLNNIDTGHELDYTIRALDNPLANDWLVALDDILARKLLLQKTFCFLGFPNTPRDLKYLCSVLNRSIHVINNYDWQQHGLKYIIEDHFSPDSFTFGEEYRPAHTLDHDMLYLAIKHDALNRLHNHFEQLQGTVEHPSAYFIAAPAHVRKAMGNLNTVCHEIESLVISKRKHVLQPEWTRPSQITSFFNAPRYNLTDQHRKLFAENQYDRRFGTVYMHWAQIGKTLFEVFRDEHAPDINATTCQAISHLKYYSGEFDIEWGRDVARGTYIWHDKQMQEFYTWLANCGFDKTDPKLSLGYLPIGQVEVQESFGTTQPEQVWQLLQQHMNIVRIETPHQSASYPYTWRDQDV